MEVLSLDIEGKFAHFRKFHGNNTAMSYTIPPRTTIIGMLAAILGLSKDSYYQLMRHQALKIGIRVVADLKKAFHRVNFLKITGSGDFSGKNGRIQTPFEIVTTDDIKNGMVKYRIYLSPGENSDVYTQIKDALNNSERQFNLTMGIANFSAFVTQVEILEAAEKQAYGEWLPMHSACNSDQVEEINFPDDAEFKFNHIEEELLPADFIGGDKGREVYRMNRVLFTTRYLPMQILLNGSYFQIKPKNSEDVENIQFLEYAGIFT